MSKILVVDDSWLSRTVATKTLKGEGYDVTEAVDGLDAMSKVEAEIPDCMVLDLLMPELDGFGVLERIREQELTIPVIVVSADIQNTTRERCAAFDVKHILSKPPVEEELLNAIRELLKPN